MQASMGKKYWWFDLDEEGDLCIYGATRKDVVKEEWTKRTTDGQELPAVKDIQPYKEDHEHKDCIKVGNF